MLGLQQRPAKGAPFEDNRGKPGAAPELEASSRRWGQELALPYAPDPTLLHLVPFIDGIRPVQDIIDACALDEDSVQICLRHLLHFGLIAVIDAVELESRYALTEEFHEAFDQLEVRADVVLYATAGGLHSSTELVEVIQGLYAGMNGYDETLGEFKQAHAAELNKHSISLRHFVTFGLLRGFLERVDQVLNQAEAKELQTLRSTTVRRKQELKEQGMTPERINKDPGIKALVTRMNALKTKER